METAQAGALAPANTTRRRSLSGVKTVAVGVGASIAIAATIVLALAPAVGDADTRVAAVLALTTQLLVTLVLVLRAKWVAIGRDGWALFALAAALQIPPAVAVSQAAGGEDPPAWLTNPAWWTASAAVAVAALLTAGRLHRRRDLGMVGFNAILLALVLASLGSALALPWLEDAAGITGVAALRAVATPLLELAAIGAVVCLLTAIGWSTSRSMRMAAIGVVLLAASRVVAFVLEYGDTDVPGRPAVTVGLVGWLAILAAAWWDAEEPGRDMAARGHLSILPVACLAGPALLLAYGAAVGELAAPAAVLGAAAVAVAVVRLRLVLHGAVLLSQLRQEATTDQLTGLPNRRQFYAALRRALAEAERGRQPLALLLIDLDKFKDINDSLGHSSGDELLARIGPRLQGAVRADDVVARLGGDEFAIVLAPGSGTREAVAVAGRVVRALESPFDLDGFLVQIGASIGIAMYPQHGQDPDELLARADVAMYDAKESQTSYELYRSERDPHTRERLELKGQLRDAIEAGQLVAHFQPKLSLVSGRIEGVEALVRWRHPDRGMLAPASFLSLAQQSGLMRPLTLAVLDHAVTQCRAWRDRGFDLHVDVNLSATNLLDDHLLSDIQRALDLAGLPPHALGVEVTEDVLLADPNRAAQVLTALRWRGVRIALDDFGSGYSSLAYLDRLPVDELKIDRYFIGRMAREPQSSAIVRSTIQLAHALGMTFVAEGVEDPAQLDVLRDLGCDSVQGYAVGRPMTADQLTTMLKGERSPQLEPVGPRLELVHDSTPDEEPVTSAVS